jgi:hypothetical protein
MRIVHRISESATPEIRRELADMGIVATPSGNGLVSILTFEVDETADSWPALREWVKKRRAVDIVSTKFSPEELADASWLQLLSEWHWGYPQPNEDVFGYREATCDLTEYCPQCGIGLKQKAPFQMKAEPKWGKNGILQLNWVFDEYFVTPEVWGKVFEPYRVGCRPVLNTSGAELKTVVQLVVEELVGVDESGLIKTKCAECDRIKYEPVTRGRFPPLAKVPANAIAKSREYFGSGASAHRAVVLSRDLAGALWTAKVRGVAFKPAARA